MSLSYNGGKVGDGATIMIPAGKLPDDYFITHPVRTPEHLQAITNEQIALLVGGYLLIGLLCSIAVRRMIPTVGAASWLLIVLWPIAAALTLKFTIIVIGFFLLVVALIIPIKLVAAMLGQDFNIRETIERMKYT